MQKKRYTKNIGILVTNESFDQLIEVTDRLEISVSKYIRQLIEEKLSELGRENNNER